jgi:tetratricopeptide (TPR) repeat protein
MAKKDPVARLRLAIEAHPGLVLDDEDDAEEFAAEIGDLGKIVSAEAKNAEALVLCVYAHRKLGDFKAAHAVAKRALALVRSFETVSAAATVFRAQDKVDAACKLFEEAATLDAKDTSALMEAGKTLGGAERFAEAERCFVRILERNPKDHEAEMWGIYAGYAGCAPENEKGYIARMRRFVKAHPKDTRAAGFLRKMTGG